MLVFILIKRLTPDFHLVELLRKASSCTSDVMKLRIIVTKENLLFSFNLYEKILNTIRHTNVRHYNYDKLKPFLLSQKKNTEVDLRPEKQRFQSNCFSKTKF